MRLVRLLPTGGWVLLVAGCLVHLAAALCRPLSAAAGGYLVATLSGGAAESATLVAIGALIAVLLATHVTDAAREVFGDLLTRRIDGSVRREVRRLALAPDSIEHLETAEFHDDAVRASDTGYDLGRVRSPGAAAIGQLVVVFRFVSALAATALLARFSVPLAVALFAASVVVRARIRRQWTHLVSVKDAAAPDQRRLAYLSELATGPAGKEVRLFGLEGWLVRRRRGLAFRASAPTWRQLWGVLRAQKLTVGLVTAAAAAALAAPGFAVLSGRISSAALVTAVLAAWAIFDIASMGREAFDIEYGMSGVAALDRLRDRYSRTMHARGAPTAVREPSLAPVVAQPPLVQFERVSFSYPGNARPVLDDVSLTLRPGRTVALVGPNGVGKTTLIKLLAGLYRPTAGRILVDGRDLADSDMTAWRRRMAVVFQDFLRYPASVADNVAFAAPQWRHDTAGVADALRRAGAEELVTALPLGTDTSLWREGAGGVDMSGGQWQQIAIARALFAIAHGRRLVVLDEPTAHLDVAAEAAFYDRVVTAMPNATVVLISHRFSTVRRADHIVLLRAGRVTEEGNHETLMAADGEYSRLFRLQSARFLSGSAKGGG
jgi:ATP-binding cassette subfamily B protein